MTGRHRRQELIGDRNSSVTRRYRQQHATLPTHSGSISGELFMFLVCSSRSNLRLGRVFCLRDFLCAPSLSWRVWHSLRSLFRDSRFPRSASSSRLTKEVAAFFCISRVWALLSSSRFECSLALTLSTVAASRTAEQALIRSGFEV